ncbi:MULTISPECIES: hypothetical protein [unclassified Janthinobacterium]|uniref:hypothetical protein n=1 Tax=unclassified Janthinobacterium TaxID=2610881 RepID=UPI0012F8F542|nr:MULTISPECIES: hypothetical protein [unclassified Janthinobacterium]MEC5160404.1 hypothetical protein [Janthinobacterium sp. CG_S6]
MTNLLQGLLCAFFVAASLPAAATGDAAQIAARAGVWSGSVGKQQVLACFDRSDDAKYYYLKHSNTIPLSAVDGKNLAWTEGRGDGATGRWRVRAVAPDRLEGEWSGPKGQRKAPIVLTRSYADADGKGNCDDAGNALSDAFNGPRLDAQKVTRQAAVFGRRAYAKLSTLGGSIQSLAFPPALPGMAGVNKLIDRFARAAMQQYFDCAAPGQDYNSSMTITYWSKNWLSIGQHREGFCGGAYPFHQLQQRTVDIAGGTEVDLWMWFKHDGKGDSQATPALQKLILSGDGADTSDPECGPLLTAARYYQLSLGDKGMVFSTTFPHVAQACDMDIVVPYAKLAPFLSESGKAALQTVQAP